MPTIVDLLEFEEGWDDTPYIDSLGYPSIGTGFKLGPKGAPLSNYKFKISKAVGAAWLADEIKLKISAMEAVPSISDAMADLDESRQAVLISMAYQMGATGLSAFKTALSCITRKDWQGAHNALLDSVWAKQTPERARRQANQLLTGKWDPEYGA